MVQHIAVHRYFMGLDLKRDISEQEAITHWYDTVYMPIVKEIRKSKILKDFPGKTEGDLYLWVLDHQSYLAEEEGQSLQSPAAAARDFSMRSMANPLDHPVSHSYGAPMTTHPLSGVYAAAVTPLKPDLSPDLDAVAPFLAFLAARGCHGALLFGTTGEGPSFSPAERADVWRAAIKVREQVPGFRLLAGTGTPSLTETIDLTRLAFDLGFDAVVTLPHITSAMPPTNGLFNWFEQVITKSVPVDGYLLGYHFPGVAGIGFSLELLSRLEGCLLGAFCRN